MHSFTDCDLFPGPLFIAVKSGAEAEERVVVHKRGDRISLSEYEVVSGCSTCNVGMTENNKKEKHSVSQHQIIYAHNYNNITYTVYAWSPLL